MRIRPYFAWHYFKCVKAPDAFFVFLPGPVRDRYMIRETAIRFYAIAVSPKGYLIAVLSTDSFHQLPDMLVIG